MPMILPCIDQGKFFPEVSQALDEPDGLLCYGGELTTSRLIQAYSKGIFPWYAEGEPILWWSPSERMVLKPDQFHLSKSLKKHLKKNVPEFYFNRDFKSVIKHCANVPRADNGTWIHPEMIAAYIELFKLGYGFCVEVEINNQLAGGIYGVHVGDVFCGESMFSLQANGSKLAMYGLCQQMLEQDFKLLDCQIHNPHLESLGAGLIARDEFIQHLSEI